MKLHWIAAVLLLATTGRATANPIPTPTWEYSVSMSLGPSGFVWNTPAGAPVTTTVFNYQQGWTPAIPTSNVNLSVVNVLTAEPIPRKHFHETGQGSYILAMSILDPSGATGTLTFSGTMNLTYSSHGNGAHKAGDADGDLTINPGGPQSIVVGGNRYTVDLSFSVPKTYPAWDSTYPGYTVAPVGEFSAHVTQTPTVPEPGTLALAAIGLGLVGLRLRRRSLLL